MIATHTVSAMTVPFGTVILQGYVLKRAVFGADAATDAGIRYVELAVSYEQAVEQMLEDV